MLNGEDPTGLFRRFDGNPILTATDWGLEDPRIVHLAEEHKYVICYTGYSRGGPVVCLATTDDFKSYKRCGAILPPSNKDASILPRKIDGSMCSFIGRPYAEPGVSI